MRNSLLALALLLAGCATAPKPRLMSVSAEFEADRAEIAALKRRVAELEKRCKPPAAHGPSGAVFQEEPK